jgi:nucleoid-associated protein YgaU
MKCYNCEKDAVRECRRCGRLYCEDHGDELCGECLKPASALPSYMLYRGSLLALLIGTAVALALLLKPPGEVSQSAPSIVVTTPTAAAARTPIAGTSVTPIASATIVGTPAPTATSTPGGAIQYTIQSGDSLFGIASQFLPPGEDLTDFANRIAAANGLSVTDPLLQPGQTLQIPR